MMVFFLEILIDFDQKWSQKMMLARSLLASFFDIFSIVFRNGVFEGSVARLGPFRNHFDYFGYLSGSMFGVENNSFRLPHL